MNRTGPIFRIADTAALARSKLGRTAITSEDVDRFPGISDEGNFYPVDPDLPAYDPEADDVVGILKSIRGLLRQSLTFPEKLSPVFIEQIKELPNVANGSVTFEANEPFRHIWLPNAPRALTLYAGTGRSLFLARVIIGQSIRAELPVPITGITVEWTVAAQTDYVHVVLSSEKMEVEVIGI